MVWGQSVVLMPIWTRVHGFHTFVENTLKTLFFCGQKIVKVWNSNHPGSLTVNSMCFCWLERFCQVQKNSGENLWKESCFFDCRKNTWEWTGHKRLHHWVAHKHIHIDFLLIWCYIVRIFFCLLFVFKDFFLLTSVLFFTHSTEGTIYFLLYCLLFINLRWVPVPVREIGVGNGERLEQFHVTIHLAIIHKGKQFVLHVHDIHNISSNEIGFTIRLFGHWG